MSVLDDIRVLLTRAGIPFSEMHHEPTRTSEDAARVRGDPLAQGGKALVLKCGDRFRLFVMSACLSLDSGAIKRQLKLKRLRFATPEELLELTGLEPGSVPPFGRPVLDLDLYVDPSVLAQPRLSFNAGSLTDSISLATADYLAIAGAEVFPFCKGKGKRKRK